ncbi:MAG: phenylacetate--CoA ligase family protein [Actinomycetota bacterium]|nr:phenylacetate--CoA ligase family protein [Actinomycetota bacterium]
MRLTDVTTRLPDPVKRPLRHIYGMVMPSLTSGRVFRETYDFLQESQWWSRKRLEEYQLEQLSMLLDHAYRNVPYYRGIFDERGLKPGDIQDLEDLKKLPCLTKDEFKSNFSQLVTTNVDVRNMRMGHTSGTSGKALQFYTSTVCRQKELAFVFHQWSRVGYESGDRRVELRGPVMSGKKLAERDYSLRVLRLSPRIENVEAARHLLGKIRDFKADFIHGYPSAVADFARFIKQYGLVVPFRIKAVLFASELVYGWQREMVEDVFDCRVFAHYGLSEQVILAAECENSPYYHCLPQYGITEFDPVTNEIIGTGFINYVNPFIRYRSNDIAASVVRRCDRCNREYFPVFKEVEGRIADYIVTSRGLIGPAALTHPFNELRHIKNTQIVQEEPDLTVLRVVPWERERTPDYRIEVDRLRRTLHEVLGNDMRIVVEESDEIETTASGKLKWIASHVSGDALEKGLK